MIQEINLANKKKTIESLRNFQSARYVNHEVRINNVHLKRLNEIYGAKIFSKNDLFVRTLTLYELMQPAGEGGRHHYHGLTPEEIYYALTKIGEAEFIVNAFDFRYVVLTTTVASCGEKIMVIIETHAELMFDRNANINKLITMYPKDKQKAINLYNRLK